MSVFGCAGDLSLHTAGRSEISYLHTGDCWRSLIYILETAGDLLFTYWRRAEDLSVHSEGVREIFLYIVKVWGRSFCTY